MNIERIKLVHSMGGRIQRKDLWSFNFRTKRAFKKINWKEVSRPKWTAKLGYRVHPNCHVTTEYLVREFYESRL